MTEPEARVGEPQAAAPTRASTTGSPTRGFLFADLRDYTRYLESHGAADAADLLVRYRSIVRASVARWDGAEIKTEGDSFYVVFPAVSAAVQCGLDIVGEAAHRTSDDARPPIPVGIGIHAGETVETPDGYVGTAVNIAARICAIAKPGEVLVSDTVRALTQTVLPVSFVARGRQKLKGVTDPVAVFAVAESSDAWAAQRGRWFRRRRPLALGAILVALVLVAGAFAWVRLRPAAGLPPGPWTIGLDMPLTGDNAAFGVPLRDAVKLAIDRVNTDGGIDGTKITLDERDDAGTEVTSDASRGAANASALVADPRTVAMIGPWLSGVAMSEIPITNAAGLLQCSPTNSYPQLTKPRFGALDLRQDQPERINYIRTSPADDIQGTALAAFTLRDLGVATTLVVDDADLPGRTFADDFQNAYTKLGGIVVRRVLNPGADPQSVLGPLSDATGQPGAVFFGSSAIPLPQPDAPEHAGASAVRQAMVDAGHAGIPFLMYGDSPDIVGSGAVEGSYLQRAGASAAGTYMSHASVGLSDARFTETYRAAYGHQPDEYAAAAYACTQVILDALRGVAATGPSADGLREAVRAYAVDPKHRHETVIGTVGFDANGDSTQQYVTFYRVDPLAAGGKGDWVIAKQQDYGPAP